MKDEEMAEQYAKDNCIRWENDCLSVDDIAKENFLAGLKVGRPQWHDLRNAPNDLPKEHIPVLVILESGVPDVSFVSTDKRWFCTDYYTGEDKVIAWCEIPTFDKE